MKPSDHNDKISGIIDAAEKSFKRGDYENAALLFQYLTAFFRAFKLGDHRRLFAEKAGESYRRAAEKFKGSARAIILCVRAAEAFHESGKIEMAKACELKAWEYYHMVEDEEFRKGGESIRALKIFGDYLLNNNNFEKAIALYEDAAEKALKYGRHLLAGGLYKDAGDCYQKIGNLEKAAHTNLKAADIYFHCREYFEAAWNYCKASLTFIRLNRMEEALQAAEKAEIACERGEIEIFLRDLSRICRLLSQGLLNEAEENWNRIKMKFNRRYIWLIESSFRAARKTRQNR